MKKLLILLFSILISFNSYGEWKQITVSLDGQHTHYVNVDTIKENNGYVYFWKLIDYLKRNEWGDMSIMIYLQGDCGVTRHKILTFLPYDQPMGNGEFKQFDGDGKWDYLLPNSVSEEVLNFVCNYVN